MKPLRRCVGFCMDRLCSVSPTLLIVIVIVIAVAITILIVVVILIFVGVVHYHMIHIIHSIHRIHNSLSHGVTGDAVSQQLSLIHI